MPHSLNVLTLWPFTNRIAEVTHTDAIEVEGEPPAKLKVEVVEDEEPQAAELAEPQEIEEVGREEQKQPQIDDFDEKPAKGRVYWVVSMVSIA